MMKKDHAYIWLDAKDFTNPGGWRKDAQFIPYMGSAYLLAAGIGTPVEDAAAEITVPREGSYRLWVRCKNWLPEFSPGRFHLQIGGQTTQTFGGQPSEDWLWADGGSLVLPSGKLSVLLQDETGFYGRCASLVLTTDMPFVPPDDMEEIRKAKQEITGVSTEAVPAGNWEVIVAGAGIAGCCAAIASARQGAKTLLVDERKAPGGNALLGVPVNGAALLNANARESGIVEELARTKAYYNISNSEALSRLMNAEPNLTCAWNKLVTAVCKDENDRITALQVRDTQTDERLLYEGKIFADCTGDGWVGYFAGAKMRRGREARREYNEEFAPEQADGNLMSGVLFGEAFLFRSVDTKVPAAFTPPVWAYRFPTAEAFGRPVSHFVYGDWFHEHHGDIDEFTQPEKARDDLIRIVLGVWDYIKNVWQGRDRAAQYALNNIATSLAKRESNRIMGDYVLTQNDVEKGVDFPDAIGYGGWPIDVHNHAGIWGKPSPYESSRHVSVYPVPYRCIYSKNIPNLFCAGRNMSLSHVALGTVRVQGTLGVIGEAAGTAAALCVQTGLFPREFGQSHMPALQQLLLKNDLYLIGRKNEDDKDLARKASVKASSVCGSREHLKRTVNHDGFLPMDRPYAICFPKGLYEKTENIYLCVSNKIPMAQYELTVDFKCSDTPDMGNLTELKTMTKTVSYGENFPMPDGTTQYTQSPHGSMQWVKFDINETVNKPYIWMFLAPVADLTVGLMTPPAPSFLSFGQKADGTWEALSGCCGIYTEPPLTLPEDTAVKPDYAPENVLNGISRIVKEQPNMWASDPAQALPQWLELAFPQPEEIGRVLLTFDTDLHKIFETYNDARPFPCAADYVLEGFDGSIWQTLAHVEDNCFRRRVHTFAPQRLEKLRLTVTRTQGSRSARVFEVRAYRE